MRLSSATRVGELLRGLSLPVDEMQAVALAEALGGVGSEVIKAKRLYGKAIAASDEHRRKVSGLRAEPADPGRQPDAFPEGVSRIEVVDLAGDRQHTAPRDWARQTRLGWGLGPDYFGSKGAPEEILVSVVAPLGLRDDRLPLRGREQVLSELKQLGPGAIVLSGLGGCGKTRVALEAAFEAWQRGSQVWWVSAAQQASLEAGMRAVARQLGAEDGDLAHGAHADETWRRLATCPSPWLLVIDNADDPKGLAGAGDTVAEGRGWLRPVSSPHGVVLVTSRDGSEAAWGSWCRRVRLDMLPLAEAGQVLADYAGHQESLGNAAEARALAERLGALPLALKIAGYYLSGAAATPAAFADETPRSYREYRDTIERGDLTVLKPTPMGGRLSEIQVRELIGATWE